MESIQKRIKTIFKMTNIKIIIELNDKQQAMYDEWAAAIKVIHGKYGNMTWSVSDCGIGQTIKVYNELVNRELNLTDVESW
jgi:hypothetical protein